MDAPQEIWFAVCDIDGTDVVVQPTHRSAAGYYGTKEAALRHGRSGYWDNVEKRWVTVKPYAALRGTVSYEKVAK